MGRTASARTGIRTVAVKSVIATDAVVVGPGAVIVAGAGVANLAVVAWIDLAVFIFYAVDVAPAGIVDGKPGQAN